MTRKTYNMDGKQVKEPFDEYVKPPHNSSINPYATEVHGLADGDGRLETADLIEIVWPRFVKFVEDNIRDGEIGVLEHGMVQVVT